MFPVINKSFETKQLSISEAEYHQTKDGIHFSSFKNIIKSPHAYYRSLKYPKSPSKNLRFGSLVHKAVLEGKDFLTDYVVEPVFRGLTKDGVETTSANASSVKAAKAEWYAGLGPNQKVVEQKEYDEIGFVMDSLLGHRVVRETLKEGTPEVRGQFQTEQNIGAYFACDFLSFDLETLIDLKTCQDSSHDAFRRSVERYQYYLQTAIYLDGIEAVFGKRPKYKLWIAVENVEPYETRVYTCHEIYEEYGKREFSDGMKLLEKCLKTNKWPQSQQRHEMIDPSYNFLQDYKIWGDLYE